MDKKLKKLSRVELLELMVSLSEDYEKLAEENNRLKQTLSAQRLPRSAKVGSIAEAALQANGYFEAVQHAADDYLREIKRLRDELVRRTDAQTPNRDPSKSVAATRKPEQLTQVQLQDAQRQASHIIAQAQAQANAILANARARAEETVADAHRKSHAIIAQAQVQAQRQAGVNGPVDTASSSYMQGQMGAASSVGQASYAAGKQPRVRKPADQMATVSGESASYRGRHSRATVEGRA